MYDSDMINVYSTNKGYMVYQRGDYLISFTKFLDLADWLEFMGHTDNFTLCAGYLNLGGSK